jgi:hypothetical protein
LPPEEVIDDARMIFEQRGNFLSTPGDKFDPELG